MFTLFIISGILLVAFFGARLIELKIGKKTVIGNLTSKTDTFFCSCSDVCVSSYKKFTNSMYRLFAHHVPSHSEKMWDGVRRFAQAKQVKAREALRGRKILKEKGSVSFFLKNISDTRRHNGGGTIIG